MKFRMPFLSALILFCSIGFASGNAAADWNAAVQGHTIPSTMRPGEVREVSVTMLNTGTDTWTRSWDLLYSRNVPENFWGIFGNYLNEGEAIDPGESKTFTFFISAPDTPGSYNCDWQMRSFGPREWWGEQLLVLVEVTELSGTPLMDAEVVSHTFPSSLHPGEVREVTLTMRNSGSTTSWDYPQHRLHSKNSPEDGWGITTKLLNDGETVAPGDTKTFSFFIVAPLTPGTYDCNWRMLLLAAGQFVFFGETAIASVEVTESVSPGLDAEVVSHTVPSSMLPGEARQVTVTMRNSGTTTSWAHPDYWFFSKNSPSDFWGILVRFLEDGEIILPGETKTFTLSLSAPTTPGNYNCKWQMTISNASGFVSFGEPFTTTVNVGEGYCGDGNIDPSEDCDPPGGCCASDCTFEPQGAACSDELFCNGEETCDGLGVCQPGTPVDCPDDGIFCNGNEFCDEDAKACASSGDPCTPLLCDEANDQCIELIDSDGDGVPDIYDNCPGAPNPGQEDSYPPGGNGIGNACDCEGDFDCDGNVDGTDAFLFKSDYGRNARVNPCSTASPCNGDFDCDGNVDGSDAFLFKTDFGRNLINNPCPACVAGDWCDY